MKQHTAYKRTALILFGIITAVNLAAFSPGLCDAYTDHVYGHLAAGLGRLTAPVPFAIGEILMYLGIVLVLAALIILILLIFLRKRDGFRRFAGHYYRTLLMILLCFGVVFTFTWAVPFRGRLLGGHQNSQRKEYNFAEIRALTEYCADTANSAADALIDSADGDFVFPSPESLRPAIEDALHGISDEFPRLSGYCPPVKTSLCSDILDRMGIGGFTYPYTMEPTHVKYSAADPLFLPALDAHELCHHFGYYKENEANFLAELALMKSSDPFLRLAGALDLYWYVEWDFTEAREEYVNTYVIANGIEFPDLSMEHLESLPKEERRALIESVQAMDEQIGGTLPSLNENVQLILGSANEISAEVYEADSHPIDDMPAVDNAIRETSGLGWQAQEAVLQENVYEGAVLLWLQYEEGKLY